MTDPFLMLFVPADRPERFEKAANAGADAIIVDLEDAVAPSAKEEARAALARLPADGMRNGGGGRVPVFVRINARATPHHEADLSAVLGLGVAGIVLPKSECAQAIEDLRARLRPGTAVHALVESAHGLAEARAIARAADRILFGSIDYALSIGAAHRRDALLAARSELVLAAALAGRPAPLDGVTATLDDADAIEADAAYAAGLGFGGKLLIHPRQIAAALRGFAPDPQAAEEARRVLGASAGGAVKLEGKMVDAPVLAQARRILDRDERAKARLRELEAR